MFAVRRSLLVALVWLGACGDDEGGEPLDGSAAACAQMVDGALPPGCGSTMEPSLGLDAGAPLVDAALADAAPSDAGPSDAAAIDAGRTRRVWDAGEIGPCVRNDAPGRVYDLCVWTTQADFARIHADAEARIEIPAEVSVNGERYEGAEFEIHGGSGRLWPKKSYRVRFREKPRPEYDFFGSGNADKIERLVLQAAWIDPTFVRNKIIFDTLREAGALAPRLGYARVYLNGKLNGLYQIIERVDEHFLEQHGFNRMGNLYKAEQAGADFRVREDPLLGFGESTNEDGMAPDLAELFRAIFNAPQTYDGFQRQVATRIDLNDFDLFNIVMSHVLNTDTFIKNYYLFHDPNAVAPAPGHLFRIIHWDADASLGIGWNTPRAPEPGRAALWSQVDGDNQDNDLARRLYGIPEYRRAYLDKFEQLLRGPLAPAAMWGKAEPLLASLEQEIRADLGRWGRDRFFDEEKAFLKEMIELRARVMAASIAQVRAQP